MQLTLLKGKIHRAVVTQCDLDYEGSISVDATLLERAGILAHEQVDVLNINNGQRFTTYAIPAPPGSGIVGVNAPQQYRDPFLAGVEAAFYRLEPKARLVARVPGGSIFQK